MFFAFISGCLWGLDTVILSIALSFGAFVATPAALVAGALISAAFHDTFCAIWIFIYMAVKKRLRHTVSALKTRHGLMVVLAAALGGPIGMCSYLTAIDMIGPGMTAIISSFYPAFGMAIAAVFLKEKITFRQVLCLFLAISAIGVMGIFASEPAYTNTNLGFIAAIITVVSWGSEATIVSYAMRSELLTNETALQIRETTSAILFLAIVLPVFGQSALASELLVTPNTGVIALAAAFGVTSYICYYKAILIVGASRSMAANISYSAWAVVFSLILCGKVPSVVEVVCCIVILASVILSANNVRELFTRQK